MNRPDAGPLLRDPLAFCGRVPWPLVEELRDGDEIVACYLVRESRRLQTRASQPYLRLVLGDRTGTIEAVAWEEVDRWEPICAVGRVIGVRGRISVYQDRPQLRVASAEPLRTIATDLELLVPASRRDRDLMERELDAQIASIRDRALRSLARRCLGRDTELGRAFRQHPAATRNHHAYLAGLLEHTLSVAGLCDRLVEHYREQGRALDRDLLITGALLHDIGKVRELTPPPAASYTTSGRLLGHIVLGIQIVAEEGARIPELSDERLLLVQHLIASHQGKPEWDSPRIPQMMEALVLHYADDLDAKVNQAGTALEGVAAGDWSEFDRSLGRSFYMPERPADPSGRTGDSTDTVIDLFRG